MPAAKIPANQSRPDAPTPPPPGKNADRLEAATKLRAGLKDVTEPDRTRYRELVSAVLLDPAARHIMALANDLHALGEMTAAVWASADRIVGEDLGYDPKPAHAFAGANGHGEG